MDKTKEQNLRKSLQIMLDAKFTRDEIIETLAEAKPVSSIEMQPIMKIVDEYFPELKNA